MDKIYHYTSFETFKKIIQFGAIRLSSLMNVDDAEEGFLLDASTEAHYTFVSCWTKNNNESIPLWKMYVDSPFAVRIAVSADILKPQFINKYFISNHSNRNGFVFLKDRGAGGMEFFSDVVYKPQPRLRKHKNLYGMFDDDYISSYGLIKSSHWVFQEEVRFVVQAVPVKEVRRRPDTSLYICCLEVMDNNRPTNIEFIDMEYDYNIMLRADIMLGPSTDENDEEELKAFIKENLPDFSGDISRSGVYIRKK